MTITFNYLIELLFSLSHRIEGFSIGPLLKTRTYFFTQFDWISERPGPRGCLSRMTFTTYNLIHPLTLQDVVSNLFLLSMSCFLV